ncbi:MAG: hypothetical protein ACM30G_09850 [Micromonosporaceae bacterium]
MPWPEKVPGAVQCSLRAGAESAAEPGTAGVARRLAAPIAAGRFRLVDFRAGFAEAEQPWPRDPECAACASGAYIDPGPSDLDNRSAPRR